MLRRLGYACLCLSLEDSSPRGTILRNATPERLRALTAANPTRLHRALEFNAARGIQMFRLSSDIVPFGSHSVNTIPWWDGFADPLAHIGELIRTSDMRISMHPGQYTVRSSPDPHVVEAARSDLVFHARLLDALVLDTRHKIGVHVRGAYADRHKSTALDRCSSAVCALPDTVRARLVLENDQRLFGAKGVLVASASTGVPVVLDVLHHTVYAGPTADEAKGKDLALFGVHDLLGIAA
jgi:UV DNA damage endonuclease